MTLRFIEPPSTIMTTVLIIAIVFGSIVAMQWIKMISKEREEDRRSVGGGSIGLGELEERMQEAVAVAIEPLREQVASLEQRIGRSDPERQLPERREEEAGNGGQGIGR